MAVEKRVCEPHIKMTETLISNVLHSLQSRRWLPGVQLIPAKLSFEAVELDDSDSPHDWSKRGRQEHYRA